MLKTTKKCTQCNQEKSTSDFPKHSQKTDGLNSWCRPCTASKDLARSRTIKGMVTGIYTSQRRNSKRRGHHIPTYTRMELQNWITNNNAFSYLYTQWVESGYDTQLKPSIDRLNDYKSYSLDNIQLTTWAENNTRGHSDRKNGINNKHSQAVLQFTLNGELIAEYYSINEASRQTSLSSTGIARVCRGKLKKSNGFIWKYKGVQNGTNS